MRIARVVTVCAALISTLVSADTLRDKRRPQSKDQASLSNPDNATDPSEVTFTTIRPDVPLHIQKSSPNVYGGPSKRLLRIRQGRPTPVRSSAPNTLKGNRRRRQLQHFGPKPATVARSYDFPDNQIESQQLETVQPPEAFDKGVVHIEPIYRVTKNKNVFDSIINIVRRIVNPPQSTGPLVGPFHFPGIGDKVYIRLLEPVRPDHLVIRLISHLPAAEIETTFDKNILPPNEISQHSEISSIGQATIVLPKDALTGSYKQGDVHLLSTDSSVSSSNSVVQLTKPANTQSQQTGHSKGEYISNGSNRMVRHRKRNPIVGPMASNSHVQTLLNRTQNNQRFQNSFQDSFDHVYPFHPPANESGAGNFEPFDFQSSQYPRNISGEVFYSHPINPFDAYTRSQSSSQLHSNNSSNGNGEFSGNAPKYSIEFASKNMRYLNLDGSVEPAIGEGSTEEFKPLQVDPVLPKVSMPLDRQWRPLRRVGEKGTHESTTKRRDHRILQERKDSSNDAELVAVDRRSGDELNSRRNATSNQSAISLEKQRSRCCSRQRDKNIDVKFSSTEERGSQTTVNNSDSNVKFVSTKTPLHLQRLQSIWRNSTNP